MYKKHAEDIEKINVKKTATRTKSSQSKQRIKDTAFAIADAMYTDSYIKADEKFIPIEEKGRNAFSVYSTVFPKYPLWGSINRPHDLLFTEWIVNGNIMLHPALTDYHSKRIEDWNTYKNNYKFEEKPFVNEAFDDMKDNYMKELNNILLSEIIREYRKYR